MDKNEEITGLFNIDFAHIDHFYDICTEMGNMCQQLKYLTAEDADSDADSDSVHPSYFLYKLIKCKKTHGEKGRRLYVRHFYIFVRRNGYVSENPGDRF